MSKVEILKETTRNPITLIGKMSGLCYGSDTTDDSKNYKRGLKCIKDGHGRVLEFPEVYLHIDGYSARVIRELYTHIGGAPTRLQESTRYIDYSNFQYVTPKSIEKNLDTTNDIYASTMDIIINAYSSLVDTYNIPKEDAAMLLPLGMTTGVSARYNARTLMTMAEQRLCTRAYWEYRELMKEIIKNLSEYSDEWKTLCDLIMKCKCDKSGFCVESFSCGRCPKKEFD